MSRQSEVTNVAAPAAAPAPPPDTPSVTVVVPTYNAAPTLPRTVASVYPQLRPGDELLIVDDGSDDGGPAAALAQLAATPPPPGVTVRSVRQPNRGVAAARNHGARAARSAQLIFLDADDFWLPRARAAFAALMVRWPDATAWSVGHARYADGVAVPVASGRSAPCLLRGAVLLRAFRATAGLLNASTFAVRREALAALGGFPEGADNGEDVVVWLALALTGELAFDPVIAVAVERPLDGRLPVRRRAPVPAHLVRYAAPAAWVGVDGAQRRALRAFLAANGVRHAAGNVVRGSRRDGWAVCRVLLRTAPVAAAVAAVLCAAPRPLLRLAYRRRNAARAWP